jgi:hypothetical protein
MKILFYTILILLITSFQVEHKHIIIGDSQTPYIDNQTTKSSRISTKYGISSLWRPGINVSWLITSVLSYPTNPNIESVVICIGTNGAFSKHDNVKKLIEVIKLKFPNSKLYVVQGSWGWGGNKNVKIDDVKSYYKRFSDLGVVVIKTPIGCVEPHGNIPIYKVIGKEIDELIK